MPMCAHVRLLLLQTITHINNTPKHIDTLLVAPDRPRRSLDVVLQHTATVCPDHECTMDAVATETVDADGAKLYFPGSVSRL